MLDQVARNAPSADTVNEVMIGRALAARHAIAAVELAMELAGGASFYRATGLERRLRDVQGALSPTPVRPAGALRRSDSAWSSDIEGLLTCVFRRIGRAAADGVEALTPEGQLRP
jgi:Acyl-CoA dehydrogenase, C-terminal domain